MPNPHLPPSDWIEKAIRIPSITDESNAELVAYLTPLLKEAGLQVTQQKIRESGKSFINLIAHSHPTPSKDLTVFNTHLDTVAPGNEADWTKTGGDPFKATRVRDRVYGLGTADVKLDFLCKLWAAKHSKPWNHPFAIVGSYGEERGLVGASRLLEANKVKPRFALVGEPSNLEIVYAHKGHLICTVALPIGNNGGDSLRRVWRGKAAHSSTPGLGINALSKALTDIFKRGLGIVELNAGTNFNKIPARCEAKLNDRPDGLNQQLFQLCEYLEELGRRLKKRRDHRFKPATNTVSLNHAQTQGKKLFLSFDVRTIPEIDLKKLKDRVEKDLKKIGVQIERLTVDGALKGRRQSKFIEQAAKYLRESGQKKVQKTTKASSTEAALYHMHGAEAFVFGPGISVGNVHRPNEYNLLSQMAIATRFYTKMMALPAGVAK